MSTFLYRAKDTPNMSIKRSLLKSTGVISIATLASRILGFARDMMIASFFGTGMSAQAFVVAFRLPNLLRDLVGEGATNAAVVPILSEYRRKHSGADYWHLVSVIFNILMLILFVFVACGIFFSPAIIRLIAPGFVDTPQQFELTVRLARRLFPYILLVGFSAYFMGVLNSLKNFAVSSWGQSLLNVSMLAAGFLLIPRFGVMGLVVGILVGGLLQVGIQIPVLLKKGMRLKISAGFKHAAAVRMGRLLLPRIFGTAVYQINIFVDTMLASLAWVVGAGGVAALYYSNRLIQFPLAIFALAMAQAALPSMSYHVADNDTDKLRETVAFSLNSVFTVMLPASIGLAILGGPIIEMLFQRGEFTQYSVSITRSALFFYSFGLFAYSGIKILVTCFYSMRDTITPVKVAGFSVALNIILNLILMWPLKIGGLALATSISATVNFFILFMLLSRRLKGLHEAHLLRSFAKILIATLILGIFLSILKIFLGQLGDISFLFKVSFILGSIILGIFVYFIAAFSLKIEAARGAARWILKKK